MVGRIPVGDGAVEKRGVGGESRRMYIGRAASDRLVEHRCHVGGDDGSGRGACRRIILLVRMVPHGTRGFGCVRIVSQAANHFGRIFNGVLRI